MSALWSVRVTWLKHVAVVALYALLTVVMTWPLAARFDRAVLGPPGDNLEYVWKMWWFKHALLERRISPFFNPDVFYPVGYPVALSETTVANTVLGLPITALWGEVVAYNTMMVFSFVLSGYGLYLLLRGLGCGVYGALVGGAIFAFCPYRMAHLGAGHLPLMGTGWIPLLFLALEKLIRRPSWHLGVCAGICLALTALSSWYYAIMVGLFAGLCVLLRARPWAELLWRKTLGLNLGLALICAGALVAPAALPILRLYGQGETQYNYSLSYVDQWSASPLDFVYPNAMHSWWGAAATRGYYQNINENLLYLGLVALVLAVWGLWSQRRERTARLYALLAGISLVLALGTTLHFAGKPVYISVPSAFEQQFSRAMYVLTGRLALHRVNYGPLQRQGAIVLPLPTLLLYLFVPFMNTMRVWARFGLLTMLAVAVLAGWGADAIVGSVGRRGSTLWQSLVAGIIALLVLVDFAVIPYPYGYTEVRGQPVDDWLARQPKAAVIHYPLDKTWYGWMLYPTRVHGQPIAYGYGTFMPRAYREISTGWRDWPSEAALSQLRAAGIRYVLVGARSYGEQWPALQRALETGGLREVAAFEDKPLFHGDRLLKWVRPSADVPATELINGPLQSYLNDEVRVYLLK